MPGGPVFENAALCEFQTLFSAASTTPSYAVINRRSGLAYEGAFPQITRYTTSINTSTYFVPFSGEAFVTLSESETFAPLLVHPSISGLSIISNFSHNGIELECLSQLNVTVANSWQGNWTANSPKMDSAGSR
ncbi:hypothetical protein XPA_010433 [Xanthoria parietina]